MLFFGQVLPGALKLFDSGGEFSLFAQGFSALALRVDLLGDTHVLLH